MSREQGDTKIDLRSTENHFGKHQKNNSCSREKKVKFQRELGTPPSRVSLVLRVTAKGTVCLFLRPSPNGLWLKSFMYSSLVYTWVIYGSRCPKSSLMPRIWDLIVIIVMPGDGTKAWKCNFLRKLHRKRHRKFPIVILPLKLHRKLHRNIAPPGFRMMVGAGIAKIS